MLKVKIKQIYQDELIDQKALVQGWIKSVRKSKGLAFVVLNDGSTQTDFQIIIDETLSNFEEVSGLLTGSCIGVTGDLVKSPSKGQAIEMQAKEIIIYGKADQSYPLQKKRTSLEFLREQAHLRVRSNTIGAVARVSHGLSFATHKFFNDRGFFHVHTPIITGSDCEGAGEMFTVTTIDLADAPLTKEGKVDWSKDYFGKQTHLTVSGQLEAEAYVLGLGQVYTFGPTFRAENSHTARHLAEFWMIEPEVAFADLSDVAELAEQYVKYLIGYTLDNFGPEIDFFDLRIEKGLKEKLNSVKNSKFIYITYTQAVECLKSSGEKFEFPISWGDDLQTEHERFLTEKHFKGPVIVTDYPTEIKAFYMKQSSDKKTVAAMDVLVPGIGEIIGGSARETDIDKIITRAKAVGISQKDLWWYLDLRRYGSAPHAGFGMGFERMLMYITGVSNIRDAMAFPRWPGSAEF